jgi:acetyl esterase/lipase
MMLHKHLRALSAAAALGLLLHTAAAAQNRVNPAEVSIVSRAPGMERAVVRRDVVFDNSTSPPLAFDAYLPRGMRAGERRPAIVFVSGAERVRQWRWFVTWGQLAAARGVVAVVPDKRYPRGLDGLRSGSVDTEKLLAHLRSDGGRLGIDPERICLWTFSAGGRLTAVGLKGGAPSVRCIVVFYGVLDLAQEFSAVTDEARRAELLRQYSPLHALETAAGAGAKLPPILVARAGKDSPSLNSGIDSFAAAALRLNAPLTLVNYPEGDHGFDGLNDTPQSRAIIEAALRFVLDSTGGR